MNTVEFRQWLEGLDQLDDAQRQVLDDVEQSRNQATLPAPVVALKEEREAERRCPHCQTERATRHGKTAQGRERYRCRNVACRKTFSEFTGTRFARMRKPESWQLFGEALQARMTLGKTAEQCGIKRNTALRWRHLLLSADDEPAPMQGIVEADETVFAQNNKGDKSIREWRQPRQRGAFASHTSMPAEHVAVFTMHACSG